MINFNNLNNEQITELFEIITPKAFKDLFKKNGTEFNKIKKGHRPTSLSDDEILSIIINHIHTPFIANFLDNEIGNLFEEIQQNVNIYLQNNLPYDIALAKSLLDSKFTNCINLFFYLKDNTFDTDKYSNIVKTISYIKDEEEKNATYNNNIRDLKNDKENLLNELDSFKEKEDNYKKTINSLEENNSNLTESLKKEKDIINQLQEIPNSLTINDPVQFDHFDDTFILDVISKKNINETMSLCGHLNKNESTIKRIYDLTADGQFIKYIRDTTLPLYFNNRDTIFYQDLPDNIDDNFYGIWSWSAEANSSSNSRDYVQSHFIQNIDAIEIKIITEASDIDALANLIRKGIKYKKHSNKVLFAIHSSKNNFVGILCDTKKFKQSNEFFKFDESIYVVPLYEFSIDNILNIENGILFYNKAFLGTPNKIYPIKSPIDIVKDIVLNSISWNAYKNKGIFRSDLKKFRELIKALPVDDLIDKISKSCHCSNFAAKNLLDKFCDTAFNYINESTIDDTIILSAINSNPSLEEKTKALIFEDWELENQDRILEAENKLKAINNNLSEADIKLKKLNENLEIKKREYSKLENDLESKKKFANDVEELVNEKIKNAQKNAADFIASMSFTGNAAQNLSVNNDSLPSNYSDNMYHIFPNYDKPEELDPLYSWDDVINTASYELAEAGVSSQYRNSLAAFLCSAYIEKQPILLIGPNAIDIAKAFAATISSHKHGILNCETKPTDQIINNIGKENESIVIINNLFSSGSICKIPDILNNKDIFYIITHPYPEDIQVEPKSIYNYMLPLFTELIIDQKPTGKYYGGYLSDDFKGYTVTNKADDKLSFISKLSLTPLLKNCLKRVLTIMHNIYSNTTVDDEFLYFVFPIYHATMNTNELIELINNPQNNLVISNNLRNAFRYLLGDI